MRLVQLIHCAGRRAVAVVDGRDLIPLTDIDSVYALAHAALAAGVSMQTLAAACANGGLHDYDSVYAGDHPWTLLPPADHPSEPARCLVSGTGLTHLASAANRDAMHSGAVTVTDSMRMYQSGVEGGRPAAGVIGSPPEWFYKGCGTVLRAQNQPLDVPAYAEDGGEEPEIAGVYLIDPSGVPRRLGMTQGNEFSDHVFEKKNYLNLAGSKLRTCAIGPELVLDPDFSDVEGSVAIKRGSATIWTRQIRTGEAHMCHSLANMEHHHFKFEPHRRPGDLHVHFYGASAFSFGEGIQLQGGDLMQVHFEGFGRPLRNFLHVAARPAPFVAVEPL
jgi:hypothetical protein